MIVVIHRDIRTSTSFPAPRPIAFRSTRYDAPLHVGAASGTSPDVVERRDETSEVEKVRQISLVYVI
jgi:hypothetical protein